MPSTPSTPPCSPPASPIPQYTTNLLDNNTPTSLRPRHLSLGSINVQGGLAAGFFHSLCEQAALYNIDIFGVQETNASPQHSKSLLFDDNNNILTYRAIWASSPTHFRGSGVGLFIHKRWFKYKIEEMDDGQGRGLAVRFGFKSAAHFAIITCYLPNQQAHPAIFDTTERWVRHQIDLFTQQGCHVLLLGDFNGVVNPSIDRANPDHTTTTPQLKLFNWLSNNSFIDTYRALHPHNRFYTWGNESRLDMIWSDPTLASYLHSVSSFPLLAPISSDHQFITATYSVHTLIRPSTAAAHGTFDRRAKKILPDDASEEQWTTFATRIDEVLCRYGNLQTFHIPMLPEGPPVGLGGDVQSEPNWDALNTVDPNHLPMDGLWRVLEDTIMSAAKHILPYQRVGGPPVPPHGANRLRARTADIGHAIHRVEDNLLDPTASHESRVTIYAELTHWTYTNTTDLNLPTLPHLDACDGHWDEWLVAARQQWCESRAMHTAFTTGKNRTTTILSAIDRRNLRFPIKPRATIKNILEEQSSRVHLDHLIIADDFGIERVIDEPQAINAATLAYFRDVWHAPRIIATLDETWTPYYAPREDIDPAWFEHLMDPPTLEETSAAITASPTNKAPGPSGLTGDLLKRLGPFAQYLCHLVLQACVVQATVPSSWLRGMLYCVPKGKCWSGRLADVRPLTLLEHGRKILFSILVNRLVSILTSHRILSGVNFSVLPGTTTKDPIHILNAVMEDAREHNMEAWILFQDIRRCFDSVSCRPGQTLERSLTRLRIHPGFIALCTNIAEHKSNVVITAYGHTEPYQPGCGLDQGGVECPMLWLLCYDVLLTAVMDSGMGYVFMRKNSLIEQRRLPRMFEAGEEAPLQVPASAFVDDTNWYAPSKANMDVIVALAIAFFLLNAIEINPKKTELIVLNSSEADPAITVGNTVVHAHDPKVAVRSLGVWFTADGKPTATKTLVINEANVMCSILERRAITDKQAIFIVNNVLIPRVLYRMAVTILPPSTIRSIVARYTDMVRKKIGLPAGTPNSILYHRRLYGLRHLGDAQDEEQIATALLRFQDQGLVGQVMASRALSLQAAAGLVCHPCSSPKQASQIKKNHFLAQVCRLMVARQISFKLASDQVQHPSVPLSDLIPVTVYSKIGPQLFRDGVAFLQDVVSADGDTLLSWADLKAQHALKGPVRLWYAALMFHLCDPGLGTEDSADDGDVDDNSDTDLDQGTRGFTPLIDPRIRQRATAQMVAEQTPSITTTQEGHERVRIKKTILQKAAASKDGALTPTHSLKKTDGPEPDKTMAHDLLFSSFTPNDSNISYLSPGAILSASNEVSDDVHRGSRTLKARSPLLIGRLGKGSADKVIKEECEEERILFEMGSEEDEPGMWDPQRFNSESVTVPDLPELTPEPTRSQPELRDSASPFVILDKGKKVIRETGMVLGVPYYEETVTNWARVDPQGQEESAEESDGIQGTRVLLGAKERQKEKESQNNKRQGTQKRGTKKPNPNSKTKSDTDTTAKKTNQKQKEKEKTDTQNKGADKRPGRTPTPLFLSSLTSFPSSFLSTSTPSSFVRETRDPSILSSTAQTNPSHILLLPQTPFPSDSDASDLSYSPSPSSFISSPQSSSPPSANATATATATTTAPSSFLSHLGPDADILFRQDMEQLDRKLAQHLERINVAFALRIANLIKSLQDDIFRNRQRYNKDAAYYHRTLSKEPQKLAQALKGRLDIANEGVQLLRAHAQRTLNCTNQTKEIQIQQQHLSAENKHLQHQEAARGRLQKRRREEEQYLHQVDEDNARFYRSNKVRLQRHLPPCTTSINTHVSHAITVLMPEPVPDVHVGLVRSGSVWTPPQQETIIQRLQQTPLTDGPRILYSDGSLLKHGSPDCAMAFAVVDLLSDEASLLSGRVGGRASSTKAELMGVFAAVLAVPLGQDLIVRLDNESVVDDFKDLVTKRNLTLPRKRSRATHCQHWAVLADMVAGRTGSTVVEWIRGHAGDPGNVKADKAARLAVTLDTPKWKVDLSAQHDIPFSAVFKTAVVEQDLRDLLKAQTTIRHHQTWSAQKRVQRAIGDLTDIEWRSTLSIIHNKRPVFTFFSSRKDTTQRTQHIKKIHGMMPTLTVMAARHPELYGEGVCCMCRREPEDNHHLWRCPNSLNAQRIAWTEAIDKVNDWGQEAIASANRDAQKRHEHRLLREPTATTPTLLCWHEITPSRLWGSLHAVFDGIDTLSPMAIDLTPPPEGRRSLTDAYLGLLPLTLVQRWKALFDTATAVASSVAHRFVQYLDTFASSRLWKTRCEATIAWEKAQNITRKQKRSPSDGGGDRWHDGSGLLCPDGFCRCGAPLVEHIEGVCPGPRNDPFLADQRLFKSIHGFYNLVLLEKRGRIPFY